MYIEQIAAWRKVCLQANADSVAQAKAQREQSKKDRRQIEQLERELHRKEKALAASRSLADTPKKSPGDLGGRRGRITSTPDRHYAVELIDEAVTAGARQHKACGRSWRSMRVPTSVWTQDEAVLSDRRPGAQRPAPANKLSRGTEREAILAVSNSPAFRSLPPRPDCTRARR